MEAVEAGTITALKKHLDMDRKHLDASGPNAGKWDYLGQYG